MGEKRCFMLDYPLTTCMKNVHLAVTVDVFGGVLSGAVLFFHEMSWVRSGTGLNRFLRLFLPTLLYGLIQTILKCNKILPFNNTTSYLSGQNMKLTAISIRKCYCGFLISCLSC